ncbi:hypothetical protein A8B82_15150 [Sulfitobacter sp. EhC04]|uniref:hypothetical protein n=1 Tax=Sulfitobacter sp. EhC04 TaxID=1849168 RepID=UPI0007F41AF1|nr:hypothetical protein [Sulfitobacter sp. EhC04]OAN76729.1 hypothetical protein A8B82_15150 [Sulfitobacter sp. EhC04]
MTDPEKELRASWTAEGVPQERQDQMIAQIVAKAQPGAMVGPFRIPDRAPLRTEMTEAGEQTVIPGCERDDPRTGAKQLSLF